jgi:hypothetical protein
MAEIFHFAARCNSAAQDNVKEFIGLCRAHRPGAAEDWTSLRWPGITFSILGTPPQPKNLYECRMADDFIDFAKSWISYTQAHNPKKNYGFEIAALRVLEKALFTINGAAEIWQCSIRVLDDAAAVARQHYSRSTACMCGNALEHLAEFLSSRGLAKDNLKDWRSPLPKHNNNIIQLGEDGNLYRENSLPEEEALNALAEIFAANPESARDIFTTSFVALLMCAPSRGSEILTLSVNAEVGPEEFANSVRKAEQATPYGWRFFSAKNFEGDIKWIPETMVGIAKTAFNRIKELTEPGRRLARWIENHPDKFYRHDMCPDVDEDQPLTNVEAARALGFNQTRSKGAAPSLFGRGLSTKNGAHTLRSLWVYVMSRLPKDFPWLDKEKRIRFSDALFCTLKNQATSNKGVNPVELQIRQLEFFLYDLGPRKLEGHKSIFDRYGYVGIDGQPLKLKTHEPRHLLNTIANRGGLSQEEIAKWSGRANPAQNRVYNHCTDAEIIADIRDRLQSASPPPSVEVVMRHNAPVTAEQFLSNRIPAVHVTEFGFCVHDFVISPCLKYRDCINCTEQICVKGDGAKLERLKLRLERLKGVLALALKDAEEETIGSDRWINHHQKTIIHVEELITLLSNEDLPGGSLVRLVGDDFSHVQRALSSDQNKLTLKK